MQGDRRSTDKVILPPELCHQRQQLLLVGIQDLLMHTASAQASRNDGFQDNNCTPSVLSPKKTPAPSVGGLVCHAIHENHQAFHRSRSSRQANQMRQENTLTVQLGGPSSRSAADAQERVPPDIPINVIYCRSNRTLQFLRTFGVRRQEQKAKRSISVLFPIRRRPRQVTNEEVRLPQSESNCVRISFRP